MNKLYLICSLLFFIFSVKAQSAQPVARAQPYGIVDTGDLRLANCDFEKGATAEILFDRGVIRLESGLSMERHIRIKVFNDFGKAAGNVRLIYHTEFLAGKGFGDIKGETFNLEDNRIVISPLDKTQIFTEKINKDFSAVIFTLPNVKAGSIIEYKYDCYPQRDWYFQNALPTRYSEIQIHFRKYGFFNTMMAQVHVKTAFVTDTRDPKNVDQTVALANVHSLPDELYMTARKTNLQRIEFPELGFTTTWNNITKELIQDKSFVAKLDESLPGEEAILKRSDNYFGDDAKIAFLFDTVKTLMKWNGQTFLISTAGIKNAWQKRTGNSAEINLILLHLLKTIGINASPMVVCTRDFGRLSPNQADPYSMNNTVVYVPVYGDTYYVLDASNRYNQYNNIPYNILDSYGLCIDVTKSTFKINLLENKSQVVQSVFVNADILPEGKLTGTAEITNEGYKKSEALKTYDAAGERNYIDSIFKPKNGIKITSFKMANMTVDSLPLSQKIAFEMNLTGSDDNYIYFSPNLFSQVEDNPFKGEERFSDIDLGYRNNYSINGIFKVPTGYKVEALPKNMTIIMPDQSILFKRTIAEDSGIISVRYVINHKKTIYFMQEYQDLRGFYKKMYELLDEQVILKKR